jgi:fumarylpyruvate hydrolase
MPNTLFDLAAPTLIPVSGLGACFPVGRIFCVGRNYADHAAEMGVEVDREAPFYFTKSTSAAALSGATVPYPPMTHDYHHEMELAFAIGKPAFRVDLAQAQSCIYGFCCALDMTRRDLQAAAKAKRRPWDVGKDVEGSAVFAALTRAEEFGEIATKRITLDVNGERRQDGSLGDMVHPVLDLVQDLSRFYHLRPGDIVMTGTPAGVGPVVAGDHIKGEITGLDPVELTIGKAE